MERATFKDLIARKLQREQDRLKVSEIEIQSLGKALLFRKPSDEVLLDIAEEIGDGESTRRIIEAYKKLIYMCCDTLQDTNLHKELEVIDPMDTVSAIMEIPEILEIGSKLVNFTGILETGEKVKN